MYPYLLLGVEKNTTRRTEVTTPRTQTRSTMNENASNSDAQTANKITTVDELTALNKGDVVTYAAEDNLEWEVRDVRVTNPDEHPHHSVSVALYEVGGTRDRKIEWDNEDGAEIVDPSKKTGIEVAKNLEEAEKENPDTTRVYLGGELFRVEGSLSELDVEVQSDRTDDEDEEEPELVTDGGQLVEESVPTPDYELDVLTDDRDRDRDSGVRYLSLAEDGASVTRIAAKYGVRYEDLSRIIYALGATLDHDVDGEEVSYTGDGYSVIVDVSHRHVVEETISREISDEDALEAKREMASKYDVGPEGMDDEDAIEHYRGQLMLSTFAAMRRLDGSEGDSPVGYPLVILAEEGDRA